MEERKGRKNKKKESGLKNTPNTVICPAFWTRELPAGCGQCPGQASDGGYMTLFSCLLFLVMMSAIFLCMDAIMICQSEEGANALSVGAGEHILANYNVPLAEKYHIYFLDPRMEGKMESRAKQYFQQIFAPSQDAFFKSKPLLKRKLLEVHIKSFGTMEEQQCLYFRHQIREYMKCRMAGNLLMDMVSQSAGQMKQHSQSVRDIKNNLDQTEGQPSQTPAPSEGDGEQKALPNAQKDDPRKRIHQIVKNGVLEFVADGKPVSESKVLPGVLPSGSHKEDNMEIGAAPFLALSSMKKMLSDLDGDALSQYAKDSFLLPYIEEHFNDYTKKNQGGTVLQYEQEYLLGGQASDKENLQYTVNRLLLLRFTLNMLYAVKDPKLNSEALALASALTGITGLVPVVEAVKYMLLGAVSFGEALIDVKGLLAGRKVPILKSGASWQVSVKGALGLNKAGGGKTGLSYGEYLALLMAVRGNKNKVYLRMQDLMQMNIMQEQPGFSIEKCRFGFEMDSRIQAGTLFLHKNYEFGCHRVFSY